MIPDGMRITITTNNPCHLTCYYTDKEPGSHRTSRNQRGLTLPWGVYYCFVAWLSLEQTEPGDTLIHTFNITPWAYCQTKWFAFRGTVAGEVSPSVSPIFKKHYAYKIYESLDGPVNIGLTTNDIEDWHGQTFIPMLAHTIVGVKLLLSRTLTVNTVTASIRAVNPAGDPIPPDLTTGTIDGNKLPISPALDWFFITLAPLNLEIYHKYAICLRAENIGLRQWGSMVAKYPRGNACASPDEGATWHHYRWDFMFEDWGTPL